VALADPFGAALLDVAEASRAMRMPGATVHAHSTTVAATSGNAVIPLRPKAVARAPFDILHNMKI
jgi:hypothetical protein